MKIYENASIFTNHVQKSTKNEIFSYYDIIYVFIAIDT